MRVAVSILFVIAITVTAGIGQTTYSGEDASLDSLSYKLYYYSQWKELFRLGQSHKFKELPYYTRLRIAYANAWTGKTLLSDAMYLQMAENRLDTNAAKTAAYQLNLSGSYDKVVHLRAKSLPAIRSKIIAETPPVFSNMVFETGAGFGPGLLRKDELRPASEDNASYKERSILNSNRFIRLGISGNISPIFEWNLDFSGVQVQRTSQHLYLSLDNKGSTPSFYKDEQGNSIAYDSSIYAFTDRSYQLNTVTTQQQINLGLGFSPASGIWIRPWGLYGKFSSTSVEPKYSVDSFLAQSYHYIYSYAPKYSFPDKKVNQDFWLTGTSIELRHRQFTYTINGSTGKILDENISQAGLAIGWNPFYNYKLKLTPAIFALKRGKESPVFYSTLLVDAWAGLKWNLQGNLAYGKMTNSQAANGQYLFNFPEENLLRYGFSVGRVLPGKITASFNLQYFQMQSTTWIFRPESGLQSISNQFNIIFTGIGLSKSL